MDTLILDIQSVIRDGIIDYFEIGFGIAFVVAVVVAFGLYDR